MDSSERVASERRRNQYKNKGVFKADELRRRRDETNIELRRQRREESIAKRRNIPNLMASSGPDSDEEPIEATPSYQVYFGSKFITVLFPVSFF